MSVPRIDVYQARHDANVVDALIVCAYSDRQKCEKHQLDGSMPLDELKEIEDDLSRKRELIFYCA